MIVGIVIIVIAVLVVLIGTNNKEAITLYYDAVDITKETVAKHKGQPDLSEGEEADSTDYAEYSEGEQPAAYEEQPVKVSVTVGGEEINKPQSSTRRQTTRREVADIDESLDELRQITKENDPVSTHKTAQSIYSKIKDGKL